MPFMGGLELAEQAKTANPALEVVIYSAYGEFDYARKAIELRAVNYLLKPIVMDHFSSTMSDIIELLIAEKRSRNSWRRCWKATKSG